MSPGPPGGGDESGSVAEREQPPVIPSGTGLFASTDPVRREQRPGYFITP